MFNYGRWVMVWWSASLKYETGEKKLNKVDFISQGMKLVSRIPTTMTKSEVEFNLRIGRRMNQGMVVEEIEVGLLEGMKISLEEEIDDESKEDRKDEEGDGECQLEAIGRRVKDIEKEARLQNSFPPVSVAVASSEFKA
ncbi:hypothetical protein Tco_1562241 [Tanacetum coccineum]